VVLFAWCDEYSIVQVTQQCPSCTSLYNVLQTVQIQHLIQTAQYCTNTTSYTDCTILYKYNILHRLHNTVQIQHLTQIAQYCTNTTSYTDCTILYKNPCTILYNHHKGVLVQFCTVCTIDLCLYSLSCLVQACTRGTLLCACGICTNLYKLVQGLPSLLMCGILRTFFDIARDDINECFLRSLYKYQ